MNGIQKDSYEGMDIGSKLNVLFDIQKDLGKCHDSIKLTVDSIKTTMEKRKKLDTATSSFFGFIGGLLGVLGINIFK